MNAKDKRMKRRTRARTIAFGAGLIMACALLAAGCHRQKIANTDTLNDTIVCFGDSITRGAGVGRDQSFCAYLSEKIGQPIINAGVSGDTTYDALARIETAVLRHDPKLVIIEFGANDFLRRIPQEETFANMDAIVKQVQAEGAMAVMLSVKVGLMSDDYYHGYKKIAKEREALVVPNILKGILFDPGLKVDSLHPNAEGHRIIAERVYKGLQPVLEYL
jgi:lysophospholipase L1-like esterase